MHAPAVRRKVVENLLDREVVDAIALNDADLVGQDLEALAVHRVAKRALVAKDVENAQVDRLRVPTVGAHDETTTRRGVASHDESLELRGSPAGAPLLGVEVPLRALLVRGDRDAVLRAEDAARLPDVVRVRNACDRARGPREKHVLERLVLRFRAPRRHGRVLRRRHGVAADLLPLNAGVRVIVVCKEHVRGDGVTTTKVDEMRSTTDRGGFS